jgi:microcystin-dependent protein
MAQISITKDWADGEVLTEADLDNIKDDVETFLNTTKINDDNIQTSGITASTKLVDASITAAKLDSSCVTTVKINDEAVTTAKLASDAVTTAKILDANVTAAKLATDSVTTAKVADSQITLAKLASALQAKLLPSGSIMAFPKATAPTSWLLCDGTAVSRATYADLFSAIGTTFGIGDGSTTFNVPNFRGRFLRMVDGATGIDPDAASRTAMVSGTFSVGSGETSSGSPTITVASTTELSIGMTVSGTNIPASSVVRTIDSATTFTLGNLGDTANVNATGTTSGLTFTFSKSPTGNYPGSVQTDQVGPHTHEVHAPMYQGVWGANDAYTWAAGDYSNYLGENTAQVPATDATAVSNGTNETRPENAYVNYIIKI